MPARKTKAQTTDTETMETTIEENKETMVEQVMPVMPKSTVAVPEKKAEKIPEQKIEDDSKQKTDDDEISLIDLFAVLWKRKWLIIIITGIAAIFSVVYSIISLKLPAEKSPLPNQFTPSSHMLINNSSSGGGGMAAMLSSSGLGGLASLAGVSTGSSFSELALYITKSNPFRDAIIDEFGFIEKWEIEKSPRASSRKILSKKLSSNYDTDSGVFSISFTDIDPYLARDVVNFATNYLERKFTELGLDKNQLEKQNLEDNISTSYNEIIRLRDEIQNVERSVSNGYSGYGIQPIMLDTSMLQLELRSQEAVYQQLKTQYEVLKITMASETPVFQILERPEIPDQKSKPSRGKLCIIITFAAGFMSVFLAFLLNAIENIKADPEAMAKLKGNEQ